MLKVTPLVLFFLLALAVGSQNKFTVMLDLFVLKTEVHMSTVLACTLTLGFVLGLLLSLTGSIRQALHYKKLKKQYDKLMKEHMLSQQEQQKRA